MLLVSDFDQTLSFNDSGIVLSDMLGIGGFEHRVAALPRSISSNRVENYPICSCMIRSTAGCARNI